MNKEIKEILDDIPYISNTVYCDLLVYITNLQQENERLKENNSDMQEEMARTWQKCDDLQQENERLEHQLEVQKDLTIKNRLRKHIYKSRCEKASEYIKEHIRIDDEYPDYMEMLIEERDDLLNILQGEDNE